MASSKVEMTLDDIIKKGRKDGPRGKKQGGSKGPGIRKGKVGKPGIRQRGNNQQRRQGGSKPGNTAATARLVQKLVKKALAQNNSRGPRNGNQKRIVHRVVRKVGGLNQRSRIIKKAPRTQTVVVERVIKPRPQPRQQVIREVIVQQPVRRQRFGGQQFRRVNNSRPKIVYVQQQQQQPSRQSFGGGGFNNRRRFVQRRANADPFYEPVNYLQRL